MNDDREATNPIIGHASCWYIEDCGSTLSALDVVDLWNQGWRIELDFCPEEENVYINYVCPICQLNKIGRFI